MTEVRFEYHNNILHMDMHKTVCRNPKVSSVSNEIVGLGAFDLIDLDDFKENKVNMKKFVERTERVTKYTSTNKWFQAEKT